MQDSGKVAVFGAINQGCQDHFIISLIVNYSVMQTQEHETEICNCITWNTLKRVGALRVRIHSEIMKPFRLQLLRRISYISTEQTQKRQEPSVRCNDFAAFIHVPSIVLNSVRLKMPNTKCDSLLSTVFFLENFALINIYRVTFEILVQDACRFS